MTSPTFDLDHPLFAGAVGRGVRVAVIDSGVHASHPHVQGVEGGVTLSRHGSEHGDYTDRIGHGTAVAAAIRDKAPGAALFIIRIFEDTLSAPGSLLVRALDRALAEEVRLVNLSLGTTREDTRSALAEVVERAAARGTFIVSALTHGTREVYPGAIPGAVGVDLDPGCARHTIRVLPGPGVRIGASGHPRPVPGVPPARNLQGVSFAVANTTGMLARLLERDPGIRTLGDLRRALEPGE